MTVTPQLRNLIKKLPYIGCIHISHERKHVSVVYCLVVHQCYIAVVRPYVGGGVHLPIDG